MENNQLTLIQDLGMIYPTEKSKRKSRYGIYKCYCGTEFRTQIQNVKSKTTKSCGCHNIAKIVERNIARSTHNLRKHRLYDVWSNMIRRCENKSNNSFKDYGVRGITVCEEWHSVKNFINDMYPSYKDGLTLDRENNDLGYSKSNCRWTNKTIQARNKRIIQKNNKTGRKGVTFRNNSFRSMIRVNNKLIHLGSYKTIDEAAIVYNNYIIENNLEHTLNIIQ